MIFSFGEAGQGGGSRRCLALSSVGLESCSVNTLHADLPYCTVELIKYGTHSEQRHLLPTLSGGVAVDINSWLLFTGRDAASATAQLLKCFPQSPA